ncbi:MAG: dialkylresorcinol condensing enzyme [Campylobacteraceae bacterium]|nr:dialkylresorcinol condensing enzyme [Campylobacteraceae bacterium]
MAGKKVLAVFYSQTGQLEDVLKHCVSPLIKDEFTSITFLNIEPKTPFPFPWKVLDFLSVFPESVYCDKIELSEFSIEKSAEFDLIIIAYQVWFLSPSLPITSFLQSNEAKVWLKNKPVITIVACRNMWLTAQEKMKKLISENGGILCDNIAFIDGGNCYETFITTPRWLLTGKKDKFWFFSPAGVDKCQIAESAKFGKAIKNALHVDKEREKKPLLKGLGAVYVNEKLIMGEKVGHRSFLIWGGFLRKIKNPKIRKPILCFYFLFLICVIIIGLPITIILRIFLYPLLKKSFQKQRIYYEEPSGSQTII